MKFTTTKVVVLSLLALTLAVSSCKKKTSGANKGEEVLTLHCSGKEFQNSKEFFRANATGQSMSLETAKKKAMSNCRNYIASNINTTVKAVTDNYVNSRTYNNVEEVEEKFEFLSREVVKQELSGLKVICEVPTKKVVDGKEVYTFYIAMELSGADLLTKMNEKISKDESLKIDYDYEKFKETFNEEMGKMQE